MTSESAIAETQARLRSGACLKREDIDLMLEDFLSPQDICLIENHLSCCEACRTTFEQICGNADWLPSIKGYLDSKFETLSHEKEQSDIPAKLAMMLAPSSDPSMIGRVGPYEVSGIVGHGGMGVVFKGFDASLNRYVAIKMLLPQLSNSGAARKRFAREAQAAAAVVHDNVLPIYGVDQADGTPYIVMQYSRGKSLHKRVQEQGPLELAEILRIGIQIARGLAAAHAQGLVHRDVKPANILLDGSVERVKLTDFGLARAVDDATLTRSGTISGTPQYMSPEQARGEPIDFQSDLFSMGSVLYTLCTGRPPFRSENSFGILRQITDEEPTPIRDINLSIPDWMCSIVAGLMEKQPQRRYESAESVAELMEQALAHVQSPQIVPLPEQLRVRKKKRAVASWAAAMFAVLATVVSIVVWQLRYDQPKKESEFAITPASESKQGNGNQGQSKNESAVVKIEDEKVPADWQFPLAYPEVPSTGNKDNVYLNLVIYPKSQEELHLSDLQKGQLEALSIKALLENDANTQGAFNDRAKMVQSVDALLAPNQRERLNQLIFQRLGFRIFDYIKQELKISEPQSKLISGASGRNTERRKTLALELEAATKSTLEASNPDTADFVKLYEAGKKLRESTLDSRRQTWSEIYLLLNDAQRAEILKRRGPIEQRSSHENFISYTPGANEFESKLRDVDLSKIPSKWLLSDPYPQLPVLQGDPDFIVTRLRLAASGLADKELQISIEQQQAIQLLNIKDVRQTYYQESREDLTMAEYKLGEILTAEQQTRLRQLAARHFDLRAVSTIRVLLNENLTANGIAADHELQVNVNKYFDYIQYLYSRFQDFLRAEVQGKDTAKIDLETILARKRKLDATIADAHQRMWGMICLSMTPDQRYEFQKAIGPELGVPPVKALSETVPEEWYATDPYPHRPAFYGRRMYADLATFEEVQQELGLSEPQIQQIQELSIGELPKILPERNEANPNFEKTFATLDLILTPSQSERLNQIVTQRAGLDSLIYEPLLISRGRSQNSFARREQIREITLGLESRRGKVREELRKSVNEVFASGNPEPEALIKLVQAGETYRHEVDDARKQVWNEVYQLLTNDQRIDYDNRRGDPPKNARTDLDSVLFSPEEMTEETPSFDVDLSTVPSDCLIRDPYPQFLFGRYDLTSATNRIQLVASGLADEELKLSEEQRNSINKLNVKSLPKPQSKELSQEWLDVENKFKSILTESQHERLQQLELRHFDLHAVHARDGYAARLHFDREQYQIISSYINDFSRLQRQTDYQLHVLLRAELQGKDASAVDRDKIAAKKKELDERVADARRKTWGKIYLAMTPEQRQSFQAAIGPEVSK